MSIYIYNVTSKVAQNTVQTDLCEMKISLFGKYGFHRGADKLLLGNPFQ